jgi:acid phosphatase
MLKHRLNVLILTGFLLALWVNATSTIAYFSDNQHDYTMLGRVVEQVIRFKPETVFMGGDVTLNGSRQGEFDEVKAKLKPLEDIAEIYPALGNHDKDPDLFLKNFPQVDSLTYYTVEKEGVVWIILNSNLKLAPGSAQYNWLVSQLEANPDKTKAVIMHHPVYSSGMHGDEKGFQFLFPALFKKYEVAAVFSGHDHIYERSERDSIYYIVFGGAGGILYNQDGRNDYSRLFRKTNGYIIMHREEGRMSVTAYDLEGGIIDMFSFAVKEEAPPLEQLQAQ